MATKTLHIDEKYSIEYDSESHVPVRAKRYGEKWIEESSAIFKGINLHLAMFHKLIELVHPEPIKPNERPYPASWWRHTNGNLYQVVFSANVDSDREDHPEYVVYQNPHNRKMFVRRASDWHSSMTEEPI